MTLSAYERETVISMNDEDDLALVTTWQRPVITKLKKNSAAEIVHVEHCGNSVGYIFRIPARLISIREPRKISAAARAKLAANAAKARQAHSSVMQQPLVTRMDPI